MKCLGRLPYVAVLVGALLASASPASAGPVVLTFSSGAAGAGGSLDFFSDGSVSGTGISLGSLTVTGALTGNGTYVLDGDAVALGLTYASLTFATGGLAGQDFLEIDGFLPGKGIGSVSSPVSLFEGELGSFALITDPVTHFVNGVDFETSLSGIASPLGILLGYPTDTSFAFTGSVTTSPLSNGSSDGAALSSDILATSPGSPTTSPVPEPASITLMASGLLYVARSVRRRSAA
jgi:hypothetical protein